ncbi:MAG: GAF domain-containing protein [Candidatus Eiseniibacteriota bacterium]|nr:MAG: GAF domain-containing protein [Candidatus Eisenbacteria bacterium]
MKSTLRQKKAGRNRGVRSSSRRNSAEATTFREKGRASRSRTPAAGLRLSKARAKFLRSGSTLLDVLHEKGFVSLKSAQALQSSLEKSVARKPEGFPLAFSSNLCERVSKVISSNSLSERDKLHREMKSLEAVSRIASSSTRQERALEKCLELLRDLVPFQNGAIFVLKEETGKLELEATLGYPQDLIERVQFDLGQGLSAWAARERRSVLVRELTRPEKEGLPPLGSFLAVPIIAGARSVGVITMGHPEPGVFVNHHKRTLQLFCTLISGSVLSMVSERQKEAVAVA